MRIRILIQQLKLMRIHADPHPDTAQDPKSCLSQLIFTSSELSEVLCSQEEERYGTRRGSLAGFLSPFFFFVWGTSALVAEINKMIISYLQCSNLCFQVLRIHDILVWIRILVSSRRQPVTYLFCLLVYEGKSKRVPK